MKQTFKATKAALKEYKEKYAPKLAKMWKQVELCKDADASNEAFDKFTAAEAEYALLVQDAFYEDTKEYNRQRECRQISVQHIEEMCQKY